MNTVTSWTSERLGEDRVRFISEHVGRGTIVVTATKTVDGIEWDKPNDVPHLVDERARGLLGV
jgi:hypothetical protein